jgi:hypothetical protein
MEAVDWSHTSPLNKERAERDVGSPAADPSLSDYSPSLSRSPVIQQIMVSKDIPLPLIDISPSAPSRPPLAPPLPLLSGCPPSPSELLYVWERMRACLYGGTGVTVRGLFVAGLYGASSGGYVRAEDQFASDWLFRACGGAAVPRLSVWCNSL